LLFAVVFCFVFVAIAIVSSEKSGRVRGFSGGVAPTSKGGFAQARDRQQVEWWALQESNLPQGHQGTVAPSAVSASPTCGGPTGGPKSAEDCANRLRVALCDLDSIAQQEQLTRTRIARLLSPLVNRFLALAQEEGGAP
jgi:hypothetical protein